MLPLLETWVFQKPVSVAISIVNYVKSLKGFIVKLSLANFRDCARHGDGVIGINLNIKFAAEHFDRNMGIAQS